MGEFERGRNMKKMQTLGRTQHSALSTQHFCRAGVTLLEVLVAIFIMGIGLLALLVLFPLGAINMAQSNQDDRAAHIAANAQAMAVAMNLRTDPSVAPYYLNLDPSTGQPLTQNLALGAGSPGYPVFVDPVGRLYGFSTFVAGGLPGYYPGNQNNTSATVGIPRTTTSFTGSNPGLIRKWFTFMDDISFDENGVAELGGGLVERGGRFSWAYLLRPPRATEPSIVDMSIVVYKDRSEVVAGELPYTGVAFSNTSNYVLVSWGPGQDRPGIKRGGWILDATVAVSHTDGSGNTYIDAPDPHGFFYRVAGVTDGGVDGKGNPQMIVELETTPRLSSVFNGQGYGVLVVLDNVVEVFDKGHGWNP